MPARGHRLLRREDSSPCGHGPAMESRSGQGELQQALAVTAAPAPLIHPNLAEVYRQRVVALQDALHDPSSRDEAFDLIRSLIDEIRLVPDNGELRIEIKGELAGILELCDAGAKQKPGSLSTAGLAEQIKTVPADTLLHNIARRC